MASADAEILKLSTFAASGIVLVFWIAAAVLIVVWVNRRVRTLTRGMDRERASEPGSVRFLLYAGGLMFWPAALAMAIVFLRKPESAHTGRVFVWILITYFSFSVLAAIAIVIWLAYQYPELLV